ncbi:hypothetical protein PHLH5_05630 [Pseudomonas sp. Cab53]|nr:hypothetical protein PHLH5_05630 [Pseudomonas sp. Cab53]
MRLWQGSLLPLGCEAVAKSWACFAVQREQAPSPQVSINRPPQLSGQALLRSMANPAQVWLTGINSRLLMLMCAGVLSTQ